MRWCLIVAVVGGCGGAETSTSTPAPTATTFTAADLRPGTNGMPSLIAPNRLEPLRLVGDKNILPDDLRSSRRASLKFCLDEGGRLTTVTLLQASGDERYDAKLVEQVQRWSYRPVVVDGKPTAVCSAMTFIYNRR